MSVSKKQPFSVLAARLQAQYPYWTWRQVCQELSRRSAAARRKPAPVINVRLPFADN